MKNTLFAFSFIFVIFFSTQAFSQSRFTLNIFSGYSMPMGDLKGDIITPDTVREDWPYQLNKGYSVRVLGKLSLGKAQNYCLTFGVNYSSFSNSGTVDNIYFNPACRPNGSVPTREFNPKVSLTTISFGSEYDFMPKEIINPFIGLDVTGSFWEGSFKFNPVDTGLYSNQTMKLEARLGLQINGGFEFKFSDAIGFVAGLKYNFANLLGKGNYDATKVSSSKINLSDQAHGDVSSRNIMYLHAYAGISLYFGIPHR